MRVLLMVMLGVVAVLTDARAQSPLLFPPEQFDAVDLVPRQSTGASFVETLGALTDRFEPINSFSDTNKYRRFGRAVGRLKILATMPNGSRGVLTCTAALIAPDQLITNYHCVPGMQGEKIEQVKVDFLYLDLGSTTIRTFAADRTPLEADKTLDYAILKVLGDPRAAGIIPMTFKLRNVLNNESLFLIHHPAGQPQRLTRAFCRAHATSAIDGTEIRHLCDTLPGSSGALVFADDDFAFVGIHHRGGLTVGDASSFNRGTHAVALQNRSTILAARASLLAGPPSGPYLVQLGSHRSIEDGFAAFADLQKKLPALEGKLPGIVEADLGDKGKYYRILIGPPTSREAAVALCEVIKQHGGACLIRQSDPPPRP